MKTRKRILELAADRPVSSSEVAEVLGVTRQTAHHHLAALVRLGDLTRTGSGRATRYHRPSTTLPLVAAWLDDAAAEASLLGGVGDSLRQRLSGPDDPLVSTVWAFDYMLLNASRERERYDDVGPFGPLHHLVGREPYPPPLDRVPDETVSLWAKLSELVTHPYLRARLNDLLWERRWSGRPYLHALTAIDAYLEFAPMVDGIESSDALGRAFRLARALKDHNRAGRVVEAALQLAETGLESAEPLPGVVLGLLDIALNDPVEDARQRAAALLHQAMDVFDDPWIQEQIIGRQLAVTSDGPEQKRRTQRRSVDLWREQASAITGMKRMFFLERALEHARTHGFREEADEIRRELQELEFDEGEIQSISTEVELPGDYIENTINGICSADNWGDCLSRLLTLGPLSGSLQQNRETVHQQAQQFVFQNLFDQHVRGPGNETIFTARSDEDKANVALARQESMAIDMASYIAAEALDRFHATHGNPPKAELEAFFTTPFIERGSAERIAASIEHYAHRRFEECVMVLLPRIERTIRELLRKIGQPVWREPPHRSKQLYGQQRPLWTLLSQLKDKLDEDWRSYLVALLVKPLGHNLRNRYMHGLVDQTTREHAAALIHAVTYLAALQPEAPRRDDPDRTEP